MKRSLKWSEHLFNNVWGSSENFFLTRELSQIFTNGSESWCGFPHAVPIQHVLIIFLGNVQILLILNRYILILNQKIYFIYWTKQYPRGNVVVESSNLGFVYRFVLLVKGQRRALVMSLLTSYWLYDFYRLLRIFATNPSVSKKWYRLSLRYKKL